MNQHGVKAAKAQMLPSSYGSNCGVRRHVVDGTVDRDRLTPLLHPNMCEDQCTCVLKLQVAYGFFHGLVSNSVISRDMHMKHTQ